MSLPVRRIGYEWLRCADGTVVNLRHLTHITIAVRPDGEGGYEVRGWLPASPDPADYVILARAVAGPAAEAVVREITREYEAEVAEAPGRYPSASQTAIRQALGQPAPGVGP